MMYPNPVVQFLSETLPARHPHYRYNSVQVAYASSMSEALAQGQGKIHFIEGDTGIGKSLAYLLTMADWIARGRDRGRQGVVATHSRALQRQLMDEENQTLISAYLESQGLSPLRMAVRMGKRNYVSLDLLSLALESNTLAEAATDDARPSAERQLAQWALETDGCLLELEEDDLPDGLTLGEIAMHESDPLPDHLREHFQDVQTADIQVINHALLAMDLLTQHGVTGSDEPVAMLLDEAEHFPSAAQNLLSQRLSFGMTRGHLAQLGLEKASRSWEQLLARYRSPERANGAAPVSASEAAELVEGLQAILKARPRKARLADPRAQHEWSRLRKEASAVLEAMREGSNQLALSYSPVKGLPSLVLNDTAGGRLLKANAATRSTILTSATLSDLGHAPGEPPSFSYIQSELVMNASDTRLGVERSHQALAFGDIRFHLPDAPARPQGKTLDGEFELQAEYVRYAWDAIRQHDGGRTLVLCVSYRDVETMLEGCPESLRDRLVTHGRGAPLNRLAESMPDNGILLTPAGWEGLSPARTSQEAFWQHVVLLRNPTPRPDPVIELALTRHFQKQRPDAGPHEARRQANALLMRKGIVQTLHKLRQGLGRSIRHPDDSVQVTILDPRFPRPDGRVPAGVKVSPRLVGAIPFRFLSAYEAAQPSPVDTGADATESPLIL